MGAGGNADAVLLGLGGLADIRYQTCDGCDVLFGDPLLDASAQTGIYIAGVLPQPTTAAILAMLQGGKSDEPGEDNDKKKKEAAKPKCN